jgi:ABC-type glutathione transport system ATPase component
LSLLLKIEKVSKIYRDTGKGLPFPALEGVSFSLETGSSLGIVGESGAGKSTLVRIIAGLETPTSGTVCFQGRPITSLSTPKRRDLKKDVQLIWQDPVSFLNPFMTVEQLMAEPMIVFKLKNRKQRRGRIRELAALVGLEECLFSKRPRQLSGGQAQRLAIARSLSLEPKLLLCDEILTGLDSPGKVQILDLLKSLQEQMGLAILLVSHDLASAAYICLNLMVMKGGRILETAPMRDFLKGPAHPYSRQLFQAAR